MSEHYLTFHALAMASANRAEESFGPIDDWSPSDWAVALAGEVGEACNEVKKMNRLNDRNYTLNEKDPKNVPEAISRIGAELADVVIYANLLATRLGLSLDHEIIKKFNLVSERVGSHRKL